MRVTMFAQFDHDPSPTHLMGYCTCRTRASEGVENNVTRLGRHTYDTLDKCLWLFAVREVHASLVSQSGSLNVLPEISGMNSEVIIGKQQSNAGLCTTWIVI